MARPFDPQSLVQHRDFMRALARSLLADEHRAEDVVQEASLTLLRRPPKAVSRAWLGQVVRNLALRVGGRESERAWREDRAAKLGARDQDALVEELDTLSDVAHALRSLTEPYRTTIYLRFYKELGPRAIAEQEGISVETVKTRLRRGLTLMRTSLDAKSGGDRRAWALSLASFARSGLEPAGAGPTAQPAASGGASMQATPSLSGFGWTVFLEGVLTMKTTAALLLTLVAAVSAVLFTRDTTPLSPPVLQTESASQVVSPSLEQSAEPTLEDEAELATTERTALTPGVHRAGSARATRADLMVLDDRGAPVEGADVAIVELGLRALTDGEGRAVLALRTSDMGAGGGELVVSCKGFLSASKQVAFQGTSEQDLGEMRLIRSGVIRGRVVDPSGRGVPDAIVFTAEPGTRPTTFVANVAGGLGAHSSARAKATTDAQGGFTLDSVRPGELRVWAGVGGGLSYGASALLEVVGGGTVEDVEVRLVPTPGVDTIAGFVVFPEEADASAFAVWARYLSKEGLRTRTAPVAGNGSFQIVVESDVPHDLWVTEGHSEWDARRHVFRGRRQLAEWRGVPETNVAPGTHNVSLRMERAPSFTVVATTFQGEELAHFELGIVEYDGDDLTVEIPWATEAESGERFSVPATNFYVTMAAEGYTKEWLGPFASDSDPGELRAVLEPLPAVRGVVVDPEGAFVSGATVEFYPETPLTSRVMSQGMRLRTRAAPSAVAISNASGEFSATLRSSGSFFLRASLSASTTSVGGHGDVWAPSLAGPLEIDHQLGLDDLELRLSRGGAIAGKVLVAAGKRATGTLVGASNGGPFVRKMVVPEDGAFRFEGLAPGPWLVTTLREDTDRVTIRNSREPLPWEGNCVVVDGEVTEIDLDLSTLALCSVDGRLAIGSELRGGWLVALNRWSELGPAEGERVDGVAVGEDGSFELVASEPGRYVLLFERTDGEDRILMMEEVELTLGRTSWDRRIGLGAVKGRLDPKLHGSGAIALTASQGDLICAILVHRDDQGRFHVPAAPAGQAQLRRTDMPPTVPDPREWEVIEVLEIREGRTISVGGGG